MTPATPEMAKHLDAIMRGLEGAGARLVDVDLPDSFPALRRAGETVLAVEAAHAHAPLYAAHAADYPPRIRELIERGHALSALQYLAAQDARRHARDGCQGADRVGKPGEQPRHENRERRADNQATPQLADGLLRAVHLRRDFRDLAADRRGSVRSAAGAAAAHRPGVGRGRGCSRPPPGARVIRFDAEPSL
jgi:Asp-tRNA(Asn)/Glu-tRNA(Gln) amidotransferase A subunit family amidase